MNKKPQDYFILVAWLVAIVLSVSILSSLMSIVFKTNKIEAQYRPVTPEVYTKLATIKGQIDVSLYKYSDTSATCYVSIAQPNASFSNYQQSISCVNHIPTSTNTWR